MKKLLLLFFLVLLACVLLARSCNIAIDAADFYGFWQDILGRLTEAVSKITDTVGGIVNGIFGGE